MEVHISIVAIDSDGDAVVMAELGEAVDEERDWSETLDEIGKTIDRLSSDATARAAEQVMKLKERDRSEVE